MAVLRTFLPNRACRNVDRFCGRAAPIAWSRVQIAPGLLAVYWSLTMCVYPCIN